MTKASTPEGPAKGVTRPRGWAGRGSPLGFGWLLSSHSHTEQRTEKTDDMTYSKCCGWSPNSTNSARR
jgi:hypothetical protein